jgi:dTDP-4-amino-4,6-dideoxygalactose transaminase
MPNEITSSSVEKINAKRNAWMDVLQKTGISTRPATHAVHMLSFYKEKYNLMPEDFPNAYAADQCSISLPLFHGMKEDEQLHVISEIKKRKDTCPF